MADFARYKYETDPGIIMLTRLEVGSLTFAGPAPSGAVDLDASAVQSNSRRTGGVRPRYATLGREVGTAPNVFTKYKKVALLTPARATAVQGLVGTSVTIGTQEWQILSVSPEERN
jgi:hypothetical protein